MKTDLSFVFDRKNTVKEPKQKGVISLRAYQNAKVKYFSTKIEVYEKEWNAKRQEINNRHPDTDELNMQLQIFKSKIEKLQTEYYAKNKAFTLDTIKDFIKSRKVNRYSYIEFVKDEIESDTLLRAKTKIQHLNTINKLLEFTGQKDVLFSEINFDFIDRFVNYLRTKNFAQNTIHKHHKNIKKFVEIAIKKGLHETTNPCKELKVKSEEKPREVLTLAELKAIENLTFEKQNYRFEQVRDMFLFACYTGLRISDVCALKPDYIKETDKGLELNFFTVKTNKHAVIPLYMLFPVNDKKSKPEQVLNKYLTRGHTGENLEMIYGQPEDKQKRFFVFPKLPEPYINRHLKVIANDAGIKFNLTFHIGRETFATYMAGKLPTPTVMKLLQHSDLKTTMRYVHLSTKMVEEQLTKVDWG
jgi:integrase